MKASAQRADALKRMKLCGKAQRVSWWIESLGKSCGQNPWGVRPLGDWPWDVPRDSIHHDTPLAFPHIVPLLRPNWGLASEWTPTKSPGCCGRLGCHQSLTVVTLEWGETISLTQAGWGGQGEYVDRMVENYGFCGFLVSVVSLTVLGCSLIDKVLFVSCARQSIVNWIFSLISPSCYSLILAVLRGQNSYS